MPPASNVTRLPDDTDTSVLSRPSRLPGKAATASAQAGQSAMSFTRKPIETEIRSNPHSYLESSAKMHAVRVLATPSSRICSEPAWGMGTERQRPRPGATNAWKMDQPREGVRSRSQRRPLPHCGSNAFPWGDASAPHAARRPRAGRFARCHLVRSTARPSTQTSTGLQYGVPRRARPTTSWEAGATSGGSRSTTTSRQVSLLANTGPQSQPYPQTEQPAGHLQLLADHAHHAVQKLSLSTVARSSRGRRGRLATTTP